MKYRKPPSRWPPLRVCGIALASQTDVFNKPSSFNAHLTGLRGSIEFHIGRVPGRGRTPAHWSGYATIKVKGNQLGGRPGDSVRAADHPPTAKHCARALELALLNWLVGDLGLSVNRQTTAIREALEGLIGVNGSGGSEQMETQASA